MPAYASSFRKLARARTRATSVPMRAVLRGHLVGLATAAGCTLLAMASQRWLQTTSFALVFPLGVLVATARFGVGPAIVTAVAGVLAFDFVFVPPALAFAIPGFRDSVTLAVMVAAAALASVLAEQLRREVLGARRQTEVEQVRNALLSALSHDLRTPLTVLVGASTALCEEGLDEVQRRDFSRMMADEATRLNRFVSNLLELTRLDSGGAHVTQTAEAIDEVIGSALCRLEGQLETRAVRTHLAPGLPPVFLDPVLVEQVIVNLIENVIRYAGPDSPIEIAACSEANSILVEVADRGPGVPSGTEEKVFQRFYRARGPSQGDGGIGLGLTICRAIVLAHEGHIWLENRRGGGTVVSFTLPVSSAARALESQPSERVSSRRFDRER